MKKGLIVVLVVIGVILIVGLRTALRGRKKGHIPIPFQIQIPQNAFGPSISRGVCMLSTGGITGDAIHGFVIWEKEGQVLIDRAAGKYVSYPNRVLSLNLTEGEPFEAASLTKLIDRGRILKGIRHRVVTRAGEDISYYYIVIKDGDSEQVYEINILDLNETSTGRLHRFLELVDETGASDVISDLSPR